LYPLVLEALTGERISVGAPFFDLTFGPLIVPLLLIVPFGPMLAWKRGDLRAAAQRLMMAFGLALLLALAAALIAGVSNVLALLGVALAAWLIVGAVSELAYRVRLGSVPFAESVRRLAGLPRSAIGTTVAHLGVGVAVLGIVAATAWSTEDILTMRPGDSTNVASYTLTLDGFVTK